MSDSFPSLCHHPTTLYSHLLGTAQAAASPAKCLLWGCKMVFALTSRTRNSWFC